MSEEGENGKRRVCRICGHALRLLQAKDKEEVEALI
jgi:hypothetical protein